MSMSQLSQNKNIKMSWVLMKSNIEQDKNKTLVTNWYHGIHLLCTHSPESGSMDRNGKKRLTAIVAIFFGNKKTKKKVQKYYKSFVGCSLGRFLVEREPALDRSCRIFFYVLKKKKGRVNGCQ
jgi:hypothetical protein